MTQVEDQCAKWAHDLARWRIPESILASASRSPWELRPDRFAPQDDRSDSPTVIKLERMFFEMPAGERRVLLDVGCGAGGVSLLLEESVDSLVGVDESQPMLNAFRLNHEGRGHGEDDLTLVHGRWPDVSKEVGSASVVLSANTLYNVTDICSFIRELDRAAEHWVVIELHERHPHSSANPAWKHFWGVDRPSGPCAQQIVNIAQGLGYSPETELFVQNSAPRNLDDDYVSSMAQRVCLDRSREEEMRDFLLENPVIPLLSRLIWWRKQ